MAYKCRICGSNEVDNQGDICELCAIGQDPYAASMGSAQPTPIQVTSPSPSSHGSYAPKRSANRKVLLDGGASIANRDPYGNDMTPSQDTPPVQVYSAGQAPQSVPQNTQQASSPTPRVAISGNQPLTTGITKNITVDNQKKSILEKWFRALFSGVPFTLDDDVTMFQVFPDYTGTSLNALGNACDQVVVYGRLNKGAVSENNDVEVYGRRDSSNNIIAKAIKNNASGTTITPQRTIGPGAVRTITAIVVMLIIAAVMRLGVEGIIWTAVLIVCLINLPKVVKIVGASFGALFSLLKRLF